MGENENAVIDIEEVVKQLFDKGLEVEEIKQSLKEMLDEGKISEEDYAKGVALIDKTDKDMASNQFGVNIL